MKFASLARTAGKCVKWTATQLGHSDPAMTLRVYAHALSEEETDLSFLDFGGTKRHPRGTERQRVTQSRSRRSATPRTARGSIVRREGFYDSLRSFVESTTA